LFSRPKGHLSLVAGVAEAMRMVSEGLEKTTGTERLDGFWGYEWRVIRDRRAEIPLHRAHAAEPTRHPASNQ
jgi:hypothetical protein